MRCRHRRFRHLAGALLVILVGLIVLGGSSGAQDSQDKPGPPAVNTTTTTVPVYGAFAGETFGGKYPPAAYTVRGKTDVARPDETAYTMATRGFFDASRSINQLNVAATRWTWRYDLVPALTPAVQAMADVTQHRVVKRFNVTHFALVLLGFYVGYLLVKGRLIHGLGEVAMGILCMIIAGYIALHPVQFFHGSTAIMREVSTALVTDDSGQTGSESLTGGIHRGLIADPWEWLSFGRIVRDTPCEPAADWALMPRSDSGGGGVAGAINDVGDVAKAAAGAVTDVFVPSPAQTAIAATGDLSFKSGTDEGVSKKLDELGCKTEKTYYENPSGDKVFGSFLLLLASIVVAALSLTVNLAIVLAQVVFALLAALAPIAVVAAILPGTARDLWWRYLALAAKSFVAAIAGCYLLVITLGFIDGILSLSTSAGMPMEMRMLMIVAIPIAAFLMRKKIIGGVTKGAGRGVASVGSSAPSANIWSTSAATAGTGGAVLGAMGADPSYSIHGRARQVGARATHLAHTRGGQLAGQIALGAATGGASVAAKSAASMGKGTKVLAGAAKDRAQRIGAQWAAARAEHEWNSEPAPLELESGRVRDSMALGPGPQRRFSMPPRPGDPTGPERKGALPPVRIAGELNPAPEAHPMPAPPPETPEVVYHPDNASQRVHRLRSGTMTTAEWDRTAEHQVLRLHERFHAEGRDDSLHLDEVEDAMPRAHRERVVDLSANLWQDEGVATFLAGRSMLGIVGQSAEERHWVRGADFTKHAEMAKLRSYQREGRLRIRGQGTVPKDEHLHAFAARVFADRPVDAVNAGVK